jgi:serine phosphatase RsbU (regulator of sigma subunit)/anti-sigma regulatory factor (Ser/Thr protein kinase)
MDEINSLLTHLVDAWEEICGGELRLINAPPAGADHAAAIHHDGKPVAWLVGKPARHTELARPLLVSWGVSLETSLNAARLSQSLTAELTFAWNRLNFMHEITGLIRLTKDHWAMVQALLELTRRTIDSERAFALQIANGELISRFVGEPLPDEDMWTLIVVLENYEHPLICDGQAVCADELGGIDGVSSFMGVQLPVSLGLPTFVGLINRQTGQFGAEDIELFEGLVEQLTTVLEIQAFHRLEMRTEQINRDLNLAAIVQSSFLPMALPKVPGYEFAARLLSASEIGGDFYDFFQRGKHGTTGIVVCDVAGKGISAALMAADVRSAVRYALDETTDPGVVLCNANTHLHPDMERVETFATAILLTLSENSVPLYASAGHASALWIRVSEGIVEELPSTSIPLGILPDISDESVTVGLRPADLVLLYSDGLTESQNEAGEILGSQRVKDVLLATHPASIDFILDALVELRTRHQGGGEAADDLTLVAVRRQARDQPETEFCTWLYLPQDLRSLEIAHNDLSRLQLWLPSTDEHQRWYMQTRLAVIEAITNSFTHAYKDSQGDVIGLMRVVENELLVDLYDRGQPFDPPDFVQTEIDLDELPEGGYGLSIINLVMDEIQYERLPGDCNHWQFMRRLPNRPTPP